MSGRVLLQVTDKYTLPNLVSDIAMVVKTRDGAGLSIIIRKVETNSIFVRFGTTVKEAHNAPVLHISPELVDGMHFPLRVAYVCLTHRSDQGHEPNDW